MSKRQVFRKVFLSHNKGDHEKCKAMAKYLEGRGCKVWYAPRDIPFGEQWDERIDNALRECEAVIVLLSKKSDESRHVKNELNLAMRYGKPVFAVKVKNFEPVHLNYWLGHAQWLEWFHEWEMKPLEQMIDLFKRLGELDRPDFRARIGAEFYLASQFVWQCQTAWLIMIALTVLVFITGSGILSKEKAFHLGLQSAAMMDQEAYEEDILYRINGHNLNKYAAQRQELVKAYRLNYERNKSSFNFALLLHELVNVGDVMKEAGNYSGAVQSYEEILRILDGYNSPVPDGQLADRQRVCERLARVMMSMNRHSDAIKYSRTAMEINQVLAEKSGYTDWASLINGYISLSKNAIEVGSISEARKNSDNALGVMQKYLKGKDTLQNRRNSTVVYDCVAEAAEAQGKLDEAEEFFRKSYETRKAVAEEVERLREKADYALIDNQYLSTSDGTAQAAQSKRELAASCHSLGKILRARGKIAEAEKFMSECVSLWEEVYPQALDIKDFKYQMQAYFDFGSLIEEQGRLDEALGMFRKAEKNMTSLADATKSAEDTANLISCSLRIGMILEEKGSINEAESYYRKAVRRGEESVRRTNAIRARRSLGSAYHQLGNFIRMNMGRLEEGKNFYEKSLEIFKAVYAETGASDDYINMTEIYMSLGGISEVMQNFSEAVDYLNTALEMNQKLAAETGNIRAHRRAAHSLNGLGYISSSQGKYSDAQEYYMRELDILRMLIVRTGSAEDRESAAKCYESIGKTLRSQGKLDEAEKFFTQAQNTRSRIVHTSGTTGTHRDSFSGLYNLGSLALTRGDFSTAEGFLTDAIESNREHSEGFGTVRNRLNQIDALGELAESAKKKGDSVQALTLYRQKLEAARKLAEDSGTVAVLRKFALSIEDVIDAESENYTLEKYAEILSLYDEQIKTRTKLAGMSGSQGDIANLIAVCLNAGIFAEKAGNPDVSDSFIMKGIEAGEPYITSGSAVTRRNLAACYAGLAISAKDMGDKAQMLSMFGKSAEILRGVLKDDNSVDARKAFEKICNTLAAAYRDNGEHEKAEELFREARNVMTLH